MSSTLTPREVLHAQDLRVAYGDTEVVRGVDLTLHAQERIGIVGESGSGKSTVALALLRLLPENGSITGGTLVIEGTDTTHYSERQLNDVRGKKISLVAQDPLTALDPVKTIGYQLREAICQRSEKLSQAQANEIAIDLLTKVGVPDAATKLTQYPHQYSGGMRQRVCIAMAIASKPSILLADEPTTALDVTTQAQVLELLDELVHDEHIAVVMISHDLGIISNFCDRVLVMYGGRVVESASSRDIFSNPQHPYTRALIDSLPNQHQDSDQPLPYIPGSPPPMETLGIGCSFAPRCPYATRACRDSNPPIITINKNKQHWAECHRINEINTAKTGAQDS